MATLNDLMYKYFKAAVTGVGSSVADAFGSWTHAKPEITNTPAAVVLGASTSTTLLASNPNRIRTMIYNPLATTLFVRKGAAVATAAAGGYDFPILPGGTWISDPNEYAGEIRGICATAGSINVSEAV